MNLANIWSIITKVIDICFVWIAFYYILKNVKNNTKMALIVKGVIIILIVKFISDLLNLYTCYINSELILVTEDKALFNISKSLLGDKRVWSIDNLISSLR